MKKSMAAKKPSKGASKNANAGKDQLGENTYAELNNSIQSKTDNSGKKR